MLSSLEIALVLLAASVCATILAVPFAFLVLSRTIEAIGRAEADILHR